MLPPFPFRTLLDLVFPPVCVSCNRVRLLPAPAPQALPGLCPNCRRTVFLNEEPCCARCGEAFAAPGSHPYTCSTCRGRSFAFDFALARCRSAAAARDSVHRLKYGHDLPLARILAAWMAPLLDHPRLATRQDWLLVPVPLHPRKQRERGFNQAAELTRWLSKLRGLPQAPVLQRIRYTASQTGFHRTQRALNLEGAFAIRPRPALQAGLSGRGVLLVDDVFTTGSTAHECARVLRETGGAEKVVVLTVARG
ncbi:MAG TPA: ComF family protein [Verrucomicrobiales bacterium]|nr:ComF family protein [Verrucomicrobiales bacterium]